MIYGIVDPVLTRVSDIIKAVNGILLVVLAALSAIALSVVGIRYIMAQSDPRQKKFAIGSLHRVFRGMVIGFGAFIIWRLAMSVVTLIINSISNQ